MKQPFSILLLFVLVSCSSNTDKKIADSKSTEPNQIDLEPIKSIIQGVWLPTDYVRAIYKTKSAFSAYRSIPNIAEIQINPDEIRNDTLYVGSSLNNHEGYGFIIWFTKQNEKIIINNNVREWDSEKFDFELKYQISPDTTLQLITKNKNGNIQEIIEYVRIRDKKNITDSGGHGYEYLARKVLLNGTYEILDSAKVSLGKVTFNAENSTIEGFKFKYYQVRTDFGAGPYFEGDEVVLRTQKEDYKNAEYYILQNIADTLILFNTEEKVSESDYKIILKDKKYYLIKH